jgi:hypothetical protein
VSTLPTLIHYSNRIPSQSNKARERNKGESIDKEEVKLYLFTDGKILYLKDSKDSTKKNPKKPPRCDKHSW